MGSEEKSGTIDGWSASEEKSDTIDGRSASEEKSGTIDGWSVSEEKSGTIDEYGATEEKSGTIDECGASEEESGTIDEYGEDEAHSGPPYRFRQNERETDLFGEDTDDDTHSSTLAEKSGSSDVSYGSSSETSFPDQIEEQMSFDLEGTRSNMQKLKGIRVGQVYDSKAELQKKLRVMTIFQKFDYRAYKSTKTLLVLKCHVSGCSWKIRASAVKLSSQFKVRKYINVHTCSVTDKCSRHRQATSKCIGELYLEKIRKVGVGIKPIHIMDVMKAFYGMDVDYWKAYKALVHARELVRGTWESGYEDLPSYLHRVKATNPGTITRLVCDSQEKFKYMFIAFGACINGIQFIRNVVVVDGAHLKGKFKGVLLVAAGQDGNGRIFPLAFGIVDSENNASWEWFLTQLRLICVDQQGLVIVSDRHKSIRKAVRKVFPIAHRGICTYHLHQNVLKIFRESDTLRLVKKAYKVYRVPEFITLLNEIRRRKPDIASCLEKADVTLWSRANCPSHRYGIMTSNVVESLNKVLVHAREYPIACFLEELREIISRWFMKRREHAMSLPTFFTRKVEQSLADRCDIGSTLTVQHLNLYRSAATGGKFACVVDINEVKSDTRSVESDAKER